MGRQRWITALILVPFILFIVVKGGRSLLAIFVALVSVAALHEYFTITAAICRGVISGKIRWLSYAVCAGIMFCAYVDSLPAVLTLVGANFLFVGFIVLSDFSRVTSLLEVVAIQVQGIVYIPLLLSLIVLIRGFDQGPLLILWVLAVVFANDTGSYYIGSYFGRRNLAPGISPKKTFEGAAGGVAAAVIVGFGTSLLFFNELYQSLMAVPCSALLAVVGQVGDLFMSALKRASGIKDSGRVLPGHGGILDRIDGLIFALPVFYGLKVFVL